MARGDTIVALDLGATTGWAVASRGRPVVAGAIHLPEPWLILRMNTLRARLRQVWEEEVRGRGIHPDEVDIWFEAALPAGDRGLATAVSLHAYCDVAAMMRADYSVPVFDQHLGTIRKQVLGKGSFGKGESNKIAAQEWCKRYGFPAHTYDVCDAIVVAEYGANSAGEDGWSLIEDCPPA